MTHAGAGILLADDDRIDTKAFRRALEKLGAAAPLTVARDGQEAWEMLNAPSAVRPGMIALSFAAAANARSAASSSSAIACGVDCVDVVMKRGTAARSKDAADRFMWDDLPRAAVGVAGKKILHGLHGLHGLTARGAAEGRRARRVRPIFERR